MLGAYILIRSLPGCLPTSKHDPQSVLTPATSRRAVGLRQKLSPMLRPICGRDVPVCLPRANHAGWFLLHKPLRAQRWNCHQLPEPVLQRREPLRTACRAQTPGTDSAGLVDTKEDMEIGPSSDIRVIWGRLLKVGRDQAASWPTQYVCVCVCVCVGFAGCITGTRLCVATWVSTYWAAPCWQLSMPYWLEDDSNKTAKAKLAGVVALTLGTTAVRCATEGMR